MSPDDAGVQRSPLPLYHQVYVVIRQRIENGTYAVGTLIPSEKELAREFGVSRITTKRALDDLAAAGMVERARGRGTTVRHVIGERPIEASIDGLLVNLAEIGRDTRIKLLQHGCVEVSAPVASLLGLAPAERVQRIVRLRTLDGIPLSLSTTFVPEHIGGRWTARDLSSSPVISLLEKAGVQTGSADQSITAVAASKFAAEHLRVAVGAPLLSIDRLVLDRAKSPVQLIQIVYRPDRFRYRIKLSAEQTFRQEIAPRQAKRQQP